MQKSSLLCASLFAVLVLSSACSSQSDRRPPPRDEARSAGAQASGWVAQPIALLFVDMDQNQDRTTERAELSTGSAAEWARLAPTSAPVNALAFNTWSAEVLGASDALPAFISFDTDLNGEITHIEFSRQLAFQFERLDEDRDGLLTRSELVTRLSRPTGGREGQGNSQRGGGGGGRPPPR